MLNFINYEQFYKDIFELIPKLPELNGVVGIPRSGMIPATMIATELHLPLGIVGCDDFFGGNRLIFEKNIDKQILIIDDTVDSGAALSEAKNKNIFKNVIYASVYVTPGSEHLVNYYSKVLDKPRIFEWNMFNCSYISNSILDMDGVLCYDPIVFDDDGIEYENSLINAKPLHIPKYPIHSIVTSRLEKWRNITENWLKKYEIQYKYLIMSQYDTAEERRKHNMAEYKAEQYLKLNGNLFIESSDWQSQKIAEITKMPVISIESKKIFKL